MYKFLLRLNNCVLAGRISAGAGLLDDIPAVVCGSECFQFLKSGLVVLGANWLYVSIADVCLIKHFPLAELQRACLA